MAEIRSIDDWVKKRGQGKWGWGGNEGGEAHNRWGGGGGNERGVGGGQYSVYFLFCPRTFSAGYFSSFITIFLPNASLRSISYRSDSLIRK